MGGRSVWVLLFGCIGSCDVVNYGVSYALRCVEYILAVDVEFDDCVNGRWEVR